jgi:hypothetical protein
MTRIAYLSVETGDGVEEALPAITFVKNRTVCAGRLECEADVMVHGQPIDLPTLVQEESEITTVNHVSSNNHTLLRDAKVVEVRGPRPRWNGAWLSQISTEIVSIDSPFHPIGLVSRFSGRHRQHRLDAGPAADVGTDDE